MHPDELRKAIASHVEITKKDGAWWYQGNKVYFDPSQFVLKPVSAEGAKTVFEIDDLRITGTIVKGMVEVIAICAKLDRGGFESMESLYMSYVKKHAPNFHKGLRVLAFCKIGE